MKHYLLAFLSLSLVNCSSGSSGGGSNPAPTQTPKLELGSLNSEGLLISQLVDFGTVSASGGVVSKKVILSNKTSDPFELSQVTPFFTGDQEQGEVLAFSNGSCPGTILPQTECEAMISLNPNDFYTTSEYNQVFVLGDGLQAQVRASITNGRSFTNTDPADMVLFIESGFNDTSDNQTSRRFLNVVNTTDGIIRDLRISGLNPDYKVNLTNCSYLTDQSVNNDSRNCVYEIEYVGSGDPTEKIITISGTGGDGQAISKQFSTFTEIQPIQ